MPNPVLPLRRPVTNWLNNTMDGADIGVTAALPTGWSQGALVGLTRENMAIGQEGPLDYIDVRYSGTTTGTAVLLAFSAATTIAARPGDQWTGSVFVADVSSQYAGSLTGVTSIQVRVNGRNSGGSGVGTTDGAAMLLVETNLESRRAWTTALLSNDAVAHTDATLRINVSNSTAVDFTLRIGSPQHQLGWMTPVIRSVTGPTTAWL